MLNLQDGVANRNSKNYHDAEESELFRDLLFPTGPFSWLQSILLNYRKGNVYTAQIQIKQCKSKGKGSTV